MLRKLHPIFILIIISLFTTSTAQSKWFLLPGISYSDEFGIVGALVFIAENKKHDRFEMRLEYYGDEGGQIGGMVFIPRKTVEWTFEGYYQVAEKNLYSSYLTSYHESLGIDVRYMTETLVRADFPKEDGRFWGLETSYRSVFFRDDFKDDPTILNNPDYDFIYGRGYSMKGGLRAGFERRNNRYHSTDGYYLLSQTDGGFYHFGGSVDPLVQSVLDFRVYHKIGPYNTVMAFNTAGGATQDDVPYFCQFQLGGSESLRGVPVNRYYGSRYYLVRVEARQMVVNDVPSPLRMLKKYDPGLADHTYSLGFVLFTDAGDAWRKDAGWWGFRQDVGIGLRIVLPPDVVGSIDVATPLDSDHIAVYFNLGQSF